MGTMSFLLPGGLSAEAIRELQRACVAGGPDGMPWPTQVGIDGGKLMIRRSVDESGNVVVPWEINGLGRVMNSTATLMERDSPYHFQVELARGKVNQLRCQSLDWRAGGLQMPAELSERIRAVTLSFGRAATLVPAPQAQQQAQEALAQGYAAAQELVALYIDQVFHARHQRQARLDSVLGVRLGAAAPEPSAAAVLQAANGLALPFCWRTIEPTEGSYRWESSDAVLRWAEDRGLPVTAGPLVDFSASQLPDWLKLWERDLQSIASFMCEYVETAVKRYRGRIHAWQLTSGSNSASVLSLGEDELLWLNVRLAEAARQIDPGLELIVGVTQPWGEYMAQEDRTHSPFIFADTLIRAGLNLAAVELELVMGVWPRGSYCRDLLETSRLLDLYALLGVPLQVTLGYPASDRPDAQADPALRTGAGHWRHGFKPEVQADWAASYVPLALCKPYVRGVFWTHLWDADPHIFPSCGLLGADAQPRPALSRLADLRQKHLR
jgi:hypothetical protein